MTDYLDNTKPAMSSAIYTQRSLLSVYVAWFRAAANNPKPFCREVMHVVTLTTNKLAKV